MESDLNVEILKALADKTRLSIIRSLQGGPLTAGDIEDAINKSQSSTSQQLKKLVEAKILSFKQDGTSKYFQARDPQIFDLIHSIHAYLSVAESKTFGGIKKENKILLLGLDDCGKTSVLLSLTGNKNLMSYSSYEPTKGYKHMKEIISQQGGNIKTDSNNIFYEAGGQVLYRKDYIKQPKKYLEGFDKIIYIIDVQSNSRYEESLKYLSEILNKLIETEILSNIAVYLHKFDPGIELKEEYSDKNINNLLVNEIRQIIPPQFNYEIFKTSIFTVFRKNLVMQSFRT